MSGQAGTVLIRVDAGSLARWVIRLAEGLERDGIGVHLDVVSGGEQPTALQTLLRLESIILPGSRALESRTMPRSEVPPRMLETGNAAPDVVMDLADGEPAAAIAGATVLRPLYNGHPGQTALASALFFSGTPDIVIERRQPGQEVADAACSGVASLEAAAGIGGAMEAVYSRVVMLLRKAVASAGQPCSAQRHDGQVRPIGRGDILRYGAKSVARQAARAAYRLCCHGSHWRVGWRFATPGEDVWTRRDLSGPRWNVLPDPVDHFYADPFPLVWQSRDYLFFEDLDYRTGKGVVSMVAFDEQGRPGPTTPVLEEPWHLSYPFLIEWRGEVWMIPESSANGDIAIYRAASFPLKWERHAVLVSGVEAADATIVEHDGLLWMFAVVRDGVGGYSDTLAIWSAADLFGPWRPHAQNPVLVDDRMARPAGAMVRLGGALYRPVQDCRAAYGAALNLMRVTRLDQEGFAQELETTLTPGPLWPGRRLHTLNYNGRLETIDGFTLRPRLKIAADMVDRLYVPAQGR